LLHAIPSGRLGEGAARFYSACVALALDHIHACGFLYCDVKLENVLLDSRGYAKLCDFGLAKKIASLPRHRRGGGRGGRGAVQTGTAGATGWLRAWLVWGEGVEDGSDGGEGGKGGGEKAGEGLARCFTKCGTDQYAPPEVARGEGRTAAADWWALGVLLHELLTGHSPFEGDGMAGIFARVRDYADAGGKCLRHSAARHTRMPPLADRPSPSHSSGDPHA
jgi:serine/threonine protein kinase